MQPLAQKLRPNSIDEFVGQEHLVAPGKPIRKLINSGQIFSMILWGPPGVGKTTLAKLIAKAQDRDFYELSAVAAGKKDVAAIVEPQLQKQLLQSYKSPVLFLDEIHRFNKAQQDFLLPYVESGQIILIGATTENPSFEVNAALLSRSKVYILKELTSENLSTIIDNAISQLKKSDFPKLKIDKKSREWLVAYSGGDARRLLNMIEGSLSLYGDLTKDHLLAVAESGTLRYDKDGEEHYNVISAFIKSMRASNPDAALYYLARMVAAGEDPKFIARRMVIFASEDIGLAQPTALVVANAVFEAVNKIGYPEAQINLAHGVVYLSLCQKDRRAYDAYFKALRDVEAFGALPVPMNLRNAPTKLMKEAGYGKGYEMYPDENTSLLPKSISNHKYLEKKKNTTN